jgi:mannose/fructose/N-acetylgalactosamine-specific phosphotransferase system component IIC
MIELAKIALLGGGLAVDGTTVGQFMLSRPIVAGPLCGLLVGDPASGLIIGVLLEIYLLVSFPSGGAKFPEGATATVVAVAAATASEAAGALPIAVAVGLVWGHVGGVSITEMRKINGRFAPEPFQANAGASRVVSAHWGGIALDFVRGSVVTGVGVVVGRAVVSRAAAAWPLMNDESLGLLIVGAAVSAGILLHDLGGFRKRRLLFGIGLALGVLGGSLI